VLVFAGDLKEIEEICCSRMDLDQILIWLGDWIGERGDLELFGALCVLRDVDRLVLVGGKLP
jgi:hypothetical protein